MSKIITDKQKIDEFLTRGVDNIYPNVNFVRKLLLSGRKLKMYLGIDPTGPDLHLGHAIPLTKLREFQELGHEAILLIGDFTGMIGDPTDKTATRKKLSRKQVLENCKNYKKQASQVIDFKKCKLKFNSKWLTKLNFEELIEISSNFTVQRMLERDMFKKRMKSAKPIYLHEFLYPLMQAYDSVALGVDGEIGGSDQTFNMLCGRDLLKVLKDREKFVLTTKLLEDAHGAKMGKTEGNMITLTDSPQEKFGKVMSWPDSLIEIGFELLTQKDLLSIKKRLKSGDNPRDLKMELAFEVVKKFDSGEEAKKARENFVQVFSKKEKPQNMQKQKIIKTKKQIIIDLLFDLKLVSSKSEARRLVQQGGVRINNKIIKNWQDEIMPEDGMVVQVGKRKFVEIEV